MNDAVNVPLNKNELMLIELALKEYRHQLELQAALLPPTVLTTMLQSIDSLAGKMKSNEESLDSLNG